MMTMKAMKKGMKMKKLLSSPENIRKFSELERILKGEKTSPKKSKVEMIKETPLLLRALSVNNKGI